MKIRLFGRIIIIPKWLKYSAITLVVILLAIFGFFIQKSRNNGDFELIENNATSVAGTTLNSVSVTPTPGPTTPPETISVYIVGEIINSDVYEMPVGSILKDLISAAGGFTEDADKSSVNLAYTLKSGMMIRIPGKNDSDKTWLLDQGSSGSSGTGSDSSVIININTATVSELCTLPGIGESTALKIINYRTENGAFSSITDIMKVSGIKESRFNDIKNYITVG